MTNPPDSGWLVDLDKVPWWVLAAILSAVAAMHIRIGVDDPVIDQLPTTAGYTIRAIGILSFFLLLFKQIDRIRKGWIRKNKRSVKRRFGGISDRQRKLLEDVYNSGSRDFELPHACGDPRWLEELANWNYVKKLPLVAVYDDMPTSYCVTETGWEEIEKNIGSK